jgi:putative addiction module component (TIGR02574 family)
VISNCATILTMSALLDEILHLTPQERLDVISIIWQSLEDEEMPLTDAQATELDRRLEAHRQHPEKTISWEEFERKL